jgi:YD repeat-containing protein
VQPVAAFAQPATRFETPAAPPGDGPADRPLPQAAEPNHGLPAGQRPPVVPPTIGTDQPARPAAVPKATSAADPGGATARDLLLRSGFAMGETSLVLYFDVGGNGPGDWASWHTTVFDPTSGTGQRSVTLTPADLARCGYPRTYCHSLGSETGWQLNAGHRYLVTVTATLRTGGDLDSEPSGQAAARATIVPPAVETPQAAGCGCPTALAVPVPLQAVRGTGVRTGTGAFHWSATDLRMPSFAMPFVADRYYSSANPVAGLLGPGWSSTYDVRVLPPADGRTDVVVRAEDGAQVAYHRNDDGSYARPPGVRSTLARTDSGWLLTTPAQIRYAFDPSGRLLSIRNTRNLGVRVSYGDSAWHVTDAAGRTTLVQLTREGLIGSVTIADGRTVRYGYTAGLLTSVVDAAGNRWRYAYTDGLLARVIDPRGITQISNVYRDGRVVTQRDADKAETTFAWDATTQEATTTDPDGVVTHDGYRGNVLVHRQNANGDVDNVRYDLALNSTLSVDPKANQYERSFDPAGNQTTALAPEPFSFTEARRYDTANNLVGFTDGEGNQGAYAYSAASELERATDPTGAETRYRYDERGLLVEATDPLGRVTRFEYDRDGNQIAKVSPPGRPRGTGTTASAGP